ncbi:hypothetical protein B0T16DRAFT_188380 [Cercophora newfieldiana]|uniref:GRF-like zinc ribbon domain-containing protein n=1 Tax=Cercophora newfieldiana TaxID=92897 RepID=A0AA40CLU9_9PEZI|nr:hypothetical protein B0T16DRAFT_188380 [Cercophora newfieldiana]
MSLSKMPPLQTPRSGIKRRAGDDAPEETPSKRLHSAPEQGTPITAPDSPTDSTAFSSPSCSGPAVHPLYERLKDSESVSKPLNSPSQTPAIASVPNKKPDTEKSIQRVRTFVESWKGPNDPHQIAASYCSALKTRGIFITLAEIWAMPKTEDGNPPWPKTYGPKCHKPGCNTASNFVEVRSDNKKGNAGRPLYVCAACNALVSWADRRGVEESNPVCFCGVPSRKAVARMIGRAKWECWDRCCGFSRGMKGSKHVNE